MAGIDIRNKKTYKPSNDPYYIAYDLDYSNKHPDSPIPFKLTAKGKRAARARGGASLDRLVIISAIVIAAILLLSRCSVVFGG